MRVFEEFEEEEQTPTEQPSQSKAARLVKIVGLSFVLGVITSCFCLGVTKLYYSGNAVSAAKQDFKSASGQEAQELSKFKIGRDQNGKEILYVDVTAEDNSTYQMQWDAEGYGIDLNKFLSAKHIEKLIEAESPKITRFDFQEM